MKTKAIFALVAFFLAVVGGTAYRQATFTPTMRKWLDSIEFVASKSADPGATASIKWFREVAVPAKAVSPDDQLAVKLLAEPASPDAFIGFVVLDDKAKKLSEWKDYPESMMVGYLDTHRSLVVSEGVDLSDFSRGVIGFQGITLSAMAINRMKSGQTIPQEPFAMDGATISMPLAEQTDASIFASRIGFKAGGQILSQVTESLKSHILKEAKFDKKGFATKVPKAPAYDMRLDQACGPSASDRDRQIRMIIIRHGIMFQYFQDEYGDRESPIRKMKYFELANS